jgi:nucleotide-binding universal stress UspA family protein
MRDALPSTSGLAHGAALGHNPPMVSRRSIRDEGHRRKFLAIVDATPECERAVAYAAQRARSTSGALLLLYVIQSEDFGQWLGVGDIMRAEAQDAARNALDMRAAQARDKAGIVAETLIREGRPQDAIRSLIEEDRDIAILVLAAGNGKEGPGPLVQSITAGAGGFAIPVTVVPFGLTDEEIDLLA